ncbi:MAG: DUF11 domain-containing protein, partial [Micrococcales bacterium]|nr:DUF11 domain-containing protein [Micrococcales bacterium]
GDAHCSVGADESEGGDVVGCRVGDLPAGGNLTLVLTLAISSSVSGKLVNVALVGSGATDPVYTNNEASALGTVSPAADKPKRPPKTKPPGGGHPGVGATPAVWLLALLGTLALAGGAHLARQSRRQRAT